ncbi:MAG: creatininase family protein [Planctomycetota bacterium]|jgi:creatinine amidohydrolase
MLWTELTATDFPEAVRKSGGVCVLPVSSIERHGGHLPLGCDAWLGAELCRRASKLEDFVWFPMLPLGVNQEAAANPGGVGLRTETLQALIVDVCDEIARNGFDRVILCSSHGGNRYLLPLIVQQWPRMERDYLVYYCFGWSEAVKLTVQRPEVYRAGGHGGQMETSAMMAARGDLVKLDQRLPDEKARPRPGLEKLNEMGVYCSNDWYAKYPYHFAGAAEGASRELGEELLDGMAARMAGIVRLVKSDEASVRNAAEFSARMNAGGTLEIPLED